MTNYENLNGEQIESFDSNYGQRLLSANRSASVNRPAKIVTPLKFNRGFSYSNTIGRVNKRENDDSTPPPDKERIEEDPMPSESLQKEESQVQPKASSSSGSRLSNLLKNFAKGKEAGKAVSTVVKVKKMKTYIIVGGIALGLLFLVIIIFAVFNAAGTTAAGMNFNDVSEYELEETGDTEIVTETTDNSGEV